MWVSQKNISVEINDVPLATVKNQSGTSAAKAKDADVKAIEDDLNSVNDEDFGDSTLTDAEVGL